MKNKITKEEVNTFTLSLVTSSFGYYIFLTFIKSLINNNFLIHIYIDLLVAIICITITIFQIKYQLTFYKNNHIDKAKYITLITYILALIITLLTYKTIDISIIIITIGLFTTKNIALKGI